MIESGPTSPIAEPEPDGPGTAGPRPGQPRPDGGAAAEPGLLRGLGAVGATSLVAGTIIGTGIFVSPSLVVHCFGESTR